MPLDRTLLAPPDRYLRWPPLAPAARPDRRSLAWDEEEVGRILRGWEDAEGGGHVATEELPSASKGFSGRLARAEFVVYMPSLLYRTIQGVLPAGHRQHKMSSRRHEASR